MLVAALAYNFGAATGLRSLIDPLLNQSPVSIAAKTTMVLVTTREISAGEELSVSNCRSALWPVTYIPEGYLTNLLEAVGKVASGPIPNNAVIAQTLVGRIVAPLEAQSNVAALVDPSHINQ